MTEYILRTLRNQSPGTASNVLLDWFTGGDGSTIQAHHNLDGDLAPAAVALDLFRMAAAVYCIDRIDERPGTWTRRLALQFPVRALDVWSVTNGQLENALGFLTGDAWSLTPITSKEEAADGATPQNPVDAVCLFSGGLDSFTGAVDLLAGGKKVCLVAHYEGGQVPGAQEELARQLARRFGEDNVVLRRLFLRPAAPASGQTRRLPATRESSTRSRSLLFLASGLLVASGYGPDVPLYIPENGFIGINVPLTNSRTGSFSTRTTHPHFMRSIGECAAALGISNPIVNPFRFMTKGEILANCRDQATLKALARRTLSCAHPEAPRYAKRDQGNCGYCFPCLIRRGSLFHVGLDDANDYAFDALLEDEALVGHRGSDRRAILRSLATPSRPIDVLRNGPVPAEEIGEFVGVYERGRAELLAWLRASTTSALVRGQLPPK